MSILGSLTWCKSAQTVCSGIVPASDRPQRCPFLPGVTCTPDARGPKGSTLLRTGAVARTLGVSRGFVRGEIYSCRNCGDAIDRHPTPRCADRVPLPRLEAFAIELRNGRRMYRVTEGELRAYMSRYVWSTGQ